MAATPRLNGTYNLDTALRLLGPANFGPSEPHGCFDHITLIINHIAMFNGNHLKIHTFCQILQACALARPEETNEVFRRGLSHVSLIQDKELRLEAIIKVAQTLAEMR